LRHHHAQTADRQRLSRLAVCGWQFGDLPIGLPSLWVFVAMAGLLGIAIAAVMRYMRGES